MLWVCNCVFITMTWIFIFRECVIFLCDFHFVIQLRFVETIIILLVIHVNINNQFTYDNYYNCHMHNDVPPFIFVFCLKKRAMCVVLVALSVVLIQNELNKFGTQYITNSICRWWSRTFRLFFLRCCSTFSSVEQIQAITFKLNRCYVLTQRVAFFFLSRCLLSRRPKSMIQENKGIKTHYYFAPSFLYFRHNMLNREQSKNRSGDFIVLTYWPLHGEWKWKWKRKQ